MKPSPHVNELLRRMDAIPDFRFITGAARDAVGARIDAWCCGRPGETPQQQAMMLCETAIERMTRWEGIPGLRAIFDDLNKSTEQSYGATDYDAWAAKVRAESTGPECRRCSDLGFVRDESSKRYLACSCPIAATEEARQALARINEPRSGMRPASEIRMPRRITKADFDNIRNGNGQVN
jgi:hypothetical protein